jgi:membrane-associated phospholipid phosphatase
VALWVFAAVTEDIVRKESLTRFDLNLAAWLHTHATANGYATFRVVTQLGAPVTLTIVAAGVTLVLAAQRQWVFLGGWLVALGGGGLLTTFLKLTIHRPRPPYADTFLVSFSWSFPSGHAMESLVAYGMLAYLAGVLWIHRRSAQIAVAVSVGLLVVAIGVSRVYLGVHYFSDVVGGYAAGTLWLATCISGVEVVRRWRSGASGFTPDSGATA